VVDALDEPGGRFLRGAWVRAIARLAAACAADASKGVQHFALGRRQGDSLLTGSRGTNFAARKNTNLGRVVLILCDKDNQLSGFFCYPARSTRQ
jgi:hypothetical protein